MLLALGAVALFVSDRPLRSSAGRPRAAGASGAAPASRTCPPGCCASATAIRSAIADRPVIALLGALGKWGFDYLALICVLAALGLGRILRSCCSPTRRR